MPVTDRPLETTPSYGGFGPVLNLRHLCSTAFTTERSGAPVPVTTLAGALLAGILLALVVLVIPATVIALTVAQVSPSLAARNTPASSSVSDTSR